MNDFLNSYIWKKTNHDKHYMVEIVAWPYSNEEWAWNVYAYIYEEHKLFLDLEAAKNLHFHKGCTYYKYICSKDSYAEIADKENTLLKVGSDYLHYHDEYFQQFSPISGVPGAIIEDANILYESLDKY